MTVLNGIRVLDFSRFGAGPVCPMLLADLGAEVIRIEKPGGEEDRRLGPFSPEGISLLFLAVNRHKQSITLNLRSDRGQEIAWKLIVASDVVVHNFSPGSPEESILAYNKLKSINPGIVLAGVSAYGTSGPYAERPGFDTIGQAVSGAMSISGFSCDPPVRPGVGWVDYTTGLFATIGIMTALYHRQNTGEGQCVDASLLDSAIGAVGFTLNPYAEYVLNGIIRPRVGNQSYCNITNSFKAKDGWVIIGAPVDPLWKRLVKTIGHKEMIDDPRFSTSMKRYQHRDLINPIIEMWVSERTVAEVVRILGDARVPCAPVYNMAQVLSDPHVKARDMLVDVEYAPGKKAPVAGMPVKLSLTPGTVEGRVPAVGEDNKEVYHRLLGYGEKELLQMEQEGVI